MKLIGAIRYVMREQSALCFGRKFVVDLIDAIGMVMV